MANRLTTEEFIAKAKQVHDNKYDYSKTKYNHSTDKVKIICPIHGEFEQQASVHLFGHGCPKCGNITISLYRIDVMAVKRSAKLIILPASGG